MRGSGKLARLRHRPELLASIAAFGVSSFFLSHAYFFVFFALIGFVETATRALQAAESSPVPVILPAQGRRNGGQRGQRRGFEPARLAPPPA